jgi:hypothetical protein
MAAGIFPSSAPMSGSTRKEGPSMNLPIHLRLRGARSDDTTRIALRAVLNAVHLLGLAAGTHLRKLRELPDPVADWLARLLEEQTKNAALSDLIEIQRERSGGVSK